MYVNTRTRTSKSASRVHVTLIYTPLLRRFEAGFYMKYPVVPCKDHLYILQEYSSCALVRKSCTGRYHQNVAGIGLQRPGIHCRRLIVAASQISTTKKSTKQDAYPVFYLRNPVTQKTGGPGFQVHTELSLYKNILVLHKLLQNPSIVPVLTNSSITSAVKHFSTYKYQYKHTV